MFSNKTGLDWISFINIFVHVIPSFVFLMSFYLYIGFIIEKYYQLSDKRIYISSTLKYILYFSLLLVLIISISAIVFKLYRESYFFIETVMSLNYLIIGFLYLIYGRKITSLLNETNKNRINNPSIMKNIRKMITSRIIPTCFIICVSYLIIGSIEGLVAIDTFGNFYPDFMDLNIFDSIIFLFCELIPSVMIGYNKKSWSNFKMEELVNQSNDDLNEREFLRVGNIGIIHGNKTLEEQMEEMLKKFIDEKNSDNVLD
jgi:hypothetical protein